MAGTAADQISHRLGWAETGAAPREYA
jgi:hypothetical protein